MAWYGYEWPGSCSWCILHGGIRVGLGRVVVSPSRSLLNVRLPILVPRCRDKASPARRHGVLHPPSIKPNPATGGSAVRAPHDGRASTESLLIDPTQHIHDRISGCGTPWPGAWMTPYAGNGTPRRVAAAHLDGQRTPRTAAGPRLPSELISATMIQLNHIHHRIRV